MGPIACQVLLAWLPHQDHWLWTFGLRQQGPNPGKGFHRTKLYCKSSWGLAGPGLPEICKIVFLFHEIGIASPPKKRKKHVKLSLKIVFRVFPPDSWGFPPDSWEFLPELVFQKIIFLNVLVNKKCNLCSNMS